MVSSLKKLFCFCHIGGEIVIGNNRELTYKNGRVDGLAIDEQSEYNDFVDRVCLKFDVSREGLTMKYTIRVDNSHLLPFTDQESLSNLLYFNEGKASLFLFQEQQREGVTYNTSRPSIVGTSYQPTASMNVDSMVSQPSQNPEWMDARAFDGIGSSNSNMQLASNLWEHEIAGVGQMFQCVKDVRVALHKFAVAGRFSFKLVKNNGECIRGRCSIEGCPWKITASRINGSKLFMIKKYDGRHEHTAQDCMNMKPAIRSKWVGNIIEEKIRQTSSYLPRQIMKDFSMDYGLDLSYHQAWRAKEAAKQAIDGDIMDSYRFIPLMCEKIIESNPGSVAVCTIGEQSRFHQLFIAFHASLYGFRNGCRPILFIDGTHLKGPFLGTMLSATALDADDGMFPIAFGVVKSETFEDWFWFLHMLKMALADGREIVIVSDRNKNIIRAVNEIFGHNVHSHCYRHLKENFLSFLSKYTLSRQVKTALVHQLDQVAYTYSKRQFEAALGRMFVISNEAHKWVVDSDPSHWANAMFAKRRYGQMYSNLAETFNGWVLKEREMPILRAVEVIRRKLSERMFNQQVKASKWQLVGKRIDDKLKANIKSGSQLYAIRCSEFEFEIGRKKKECVVNLQNRVCSCNVWQATGLPCQHACRAIQLSNFDIYGYVEDCYHKETQMLIYSQLMHGIDTSEIPFHCSSNSDDLGNEDEHGNEEPILLPPMTRRPPGRPRRKRIESQSVDRRPLHCSRCKEEGHNRKTCRAPI